jgi:hypothetical protein
MEYYEQTFASLAGFAYMLVSMTIVYMVFTSSDMKDDALCDRINRLGEQVQEIKDILEDPMDNDSESADTEEPEQRDITVKHFLAGTDNPIYAIKDGRITTVVVLYNQVSHQVIRLHEIIGVRGQYLVYTEHDTPKTLWLNARDEDLPAMTKFFESL